MKFKSWLESIIPVSKARQIQKGLKNYKPSTFGVEIEFKATVENQFYALFNSLDMLEAWKEGYLLAPTMKQWHKSNPKPQEDDYDDKSDWEKALEEWKEEQKEQQDAVDRWKTLSVDDLPFGSKWRKDYEDFIRNVIEEELEPLPNVKTKITQYIKFLDKIGVNVQEGDAEGTTWGVGVDGTKTVEIRTGILTQQDFPELLKLISEINKNKEQVDGSTSVHVHIGLPKDLDSFDLLAIATLADERTILKDVPQRDLKFTKLRRNINDQLYYLINPGMYTKYEFEEAIQKYLQDADRNRGTNLQAFRRHGTVEFRYLSGEILSNPKKLVQYIKYYLMLPHIAKTKKQLKFEELTFTRFPGGAVEVTRSPNATQAYGKAADLRSVAPKPYDVIKISNRLKKASIRRLEYGYGDLYTILLKGYLANHPNTDPMTRLSDIWDSIPQTVKDQLIDAYLRDYDDDLRF